MTAPLDVTFLRRCLGTLDHALAALQRHDPGDIEYDVFRAACVKDFELVLEQSGKLLKKRLKPYFASNRQVDRLRRMIEDLLDRFLPGVEVWAYGSRVNGQSHDGSDLDLVLRAPDLGPIPLGSLGEITDTGFSHSALTFAGPGVTFDRMRQLRVVPGVLACSRIAGFRLREWAIPINSNSRRETAMNVKRHLIGAAIAGLAIALACGGEAIDDATATGAGEGPEAPRFEVDPFWPKPLPEHWLLGSTIGVGVDSRDHVFIIHRRASIDARTELGAEADPPTAECCRAAPEVLEFDPEGNLVNSWGGPSDEYVWPASNHGITVDHMDNVWIGGNGATDSHILKFSRDGRFLASYGQPEVGSEPDSHSETRFNRVAEVAFDAEANEAYVADGYGGRRVAVLDASTGAFKRYWGAYGNAPDDTPTPPYDPDAPPLQQFRTPVHCAEPSLDGLVYVCDRPNDRIQVFRTDGTFVDEVMIAPRTLGGGSTWDLAFSRDPGQRYMYVADGTNHRVYVMDRASLKVLTTFGDGGRQPGQFIGVHSIATDSRGNVYTTETYEGKRIQKFVYMGLGPVSAEHQGAPWPAGGGGR